MKFIEIGDRLVNMDLVTTVDSTMNGKSSRIYYPGSETAYDTVAVPYEKVKKLFLNGGVVTRQSIAEEIAREIGGVAEGMSMEFGFKDQEYPHAFDDVDPGFLAGLEYAQQICIGEEPNDD